MSFTKLNYCQYLLSSPVNYTVPNLADHLDGVSHDRINRYLRGEKLTPRLLWDNVKSLLQPSEKGYLLFDDTVLDKRYSASIELTRRQYSGNEHRVICGIGLISCVYVSPVKVTFYFGLAGGPLRHADACHQRSAVVFSFWEIAVA